MASTLLTSPHLILSIDHVRAIAIIERTSKRFRDHAELERAISDMARTFPDGTRSRLGVLVDMRNSPPRVEVYLESLFERFRTENLRAFRRGAILLSSTFGMVRAQRLHPKGHTAPIAFVQTREEALAFLAGTSA